ncbi:hypothetical protein RirG_002270 [Rhizophagus irregularis DAOM 197198w]|uniref:Uncharacterized protein n=1 Tax=Rhizophagus irregularis (strain DAOM 197198w) TaxID=1432141 RepID=A0A015LJ86_RHIIW|nr:hypothetical protein RirG_002270 [Rhizophagus irregularis DAOM 197198w]
MEFSKGLILNTKRKVVTLAAAAAILATATFASTADAAKVRGPGGTAQIDFIDSNKLVYWEVNPSTVYAAYAFSGNIKFGNGTSVGVWESGWGAEGGTENAGASKKSATLTGTAYATNGKAYDVLPGVTAYPQ